MRRLFSIAAGLALSSAVVGQTFDFNLPTDDRWQYPFNFSGGNRATASTFSSLGSGIPSFNNFNDRDGLVLVAWDTSALIAPGLGAANYSIASVRVVVTNESGATWPIDMTVDEWFTNDVNNSGSINADGVPRGQPGDTDGESSDSDPGRTVELFGMGFGPNYTAATWTEASAYVGGTNTTFAQRDPFPMDFDAGQPRHIEDHVQVGFFTPTPWAIGAPVGYTPGAQNVPFDVVFDVDLSVSGGFVRAYFQERLNAGRVLITLSSLTDTIQGGTPGGVPSFYQSEAIGIPLAKAPQLLITLGSPDVPGDVDGNGCVNLTDLATLLSNFGATSGQTRADGDLDGDGDVDLTDLATLLSNFGGGTC